MNKNANKTDIHRDADDITATMDVMVELAYDGDADALYCLELIRVVIADWIKSMDAKQAANS
jgi:hypothetical protein